MRTFLLLFMVAAASAQAPERTLVLEACVQCHDLKAITSQKKSEAAWRRTVNEIIWRGAPLMPGEADAITKYLTSWSAGVPPAPAGRPARPLPPGAGRELVTRSCVQCHDLEVTTTQRKTADEWRRSVEQMARLGARLTGDEIQIVSRYLAGAFGKPTT